MSSKKEYKHLWYLQNRDKELAKAKENRLKRPEIRKSWLKKNGSKPKVRFDKAKSNSSIKRGRLWNLTFDQYEQLISKNCHYCDVSIANEKGCGLDRLNNDIGYELENVVPCCKVCNIGRNANFSSEEWKIGVQAILDFRKKGQKC